LTCDSDDDEVEGSVHDFTDTGTMNAWLARGGFDRNIAGVPFDREEMVKRHREGEDLGPAMAAFVPIGWPVGGGHGALARRPVAELALADRFGAPLFDSTEEDDR
jgi:hypothetical protein